MTRVTVGKLIGFVILMLFIAFVCWPLTVGFVSGASTSGLEAGGQNLAQLFNNLTGGGEQPVVEVTRVVTEIVTEEGETIFLTRPAETPEPAVTEPVTTTATSGGTGPILLTDFNSIMATEVFTYTPGGEGFGEWATDVTLPSDDYEVDDCGRVWQATNLKNLPWTAVFCNWQTSDGDDLKIQWPHPTQMTVSGSGILEFDLWRDLAASNEVNPDPYTVANAGNSPLGLGWFAQGFNGTVCVNGECQILEGGGVYQLAFPADWDGHYDVRIVVDNGQVQFWQGEKWTSVDNWPLPSQ